MGARLAILFVVFTFAYLELNARLIARLQVYHPLVWNRLKGMHPLVPFLAQLQIQRLRPKA